MPSLNSCAVPLLFVLAIVVVIILMNNNSTTENSDGFLVDGSFVTNTGAAPPLPSGQWPHLPPAPDGVAFENFQDPIPDPLVPEITKSKFANRAYAGATVLRPDLGPPKSSPLEFNIGSTAIIDVNKYRRNLPGCI
jgi:hypothetical protein